MTVSTRFNIRNLARFAAKKRSDEERQEPIEKGFDYKAANILPGDLRVNDEYHIDGKRQYYVHHSAKPQRLHKDEDVVQCPYCKLFFWVPFGAEVHPSCAGRNIFKKR